VKGGKHGVIACSPSSRHLLQSLIPPAVLAVTCANVEHNVDVCLQAKGKQFHYLLLPNYLLQYYIFQTSMNNRKTMRTNKKYHRIHTISTPNIRDSKGFWRWCITLRIIAFSDFVHSPVFYLSMTLQPSWTLASFSVSVGLLGGGISPSQGRYLHTEQHENRTNAHRHPCFEWDSKPRSQCSSERRQFMP
jgi:hypothetical protein